MVYRDIRVCIRLTQEEYDHLLREARGDTEMHYSTGEVNLSGYIRKSALKEFHCHEVQLHQLNQKLKDLTYQIRKIGVNINQATKKINSGFGTANAVSELQDKMALLNRNFADFMNLLDEWGE